MTEQLHFTLLHVGKVVFSKWKICKAFLFWLLCRELPAWSQSSGERVRTFLPEAWCPWRPTSQGKEFTRDTGDNCEVLVAAGSPVCPARVPGLTLEPVGGQ